MTHKVRSGVCTMNRPALSVLHMFLYVAAAVSRYVAMDDTAAASELGVDFQTDVVTAEMSAGDVLLFNNIIPHRSVAALKLPTSSVKFCSGQHHITSGMQLPKQHDSVIDTCRAVL